MSQTIVLFVVSATISLVQVKETKRKENVNKSWSKDGQQLTFLVLHHTAAVPNGFENVFFSPVLLTFIQD